jgi:hypothetical protein
MAHPVPSPSPRTLQRVGPLLYLVDPAGHGGPVRTRRGNRVTDRAAASPLSRLRAGQLRWLLAVGHFGSAVDAAL